MLASVLFENLLSETKTNWLKELSYSGTFVDYFKVSAFVNLSYWLIDKNAWKYGYIKRRHNINILKLLLANSS